MEAIHVIQKLGLMYSLLLGKKLPNIIHEINKINGTQQQMILYFFVPCPQLSTNLVGYENLGSFKPIYEDEFVTVKLAEFYKSIFRGSDGDIQSIEACVKELTTIFVAIDKVVPKTAPNASEKEKLSQLWDARYILAATSFLASDRGSFVPWIATTDSTSWLKDIYISKAPSKTERVNKNLPPSPIQMGLGQLLLTTIYHTTTVSLMEGKAEGGMFLQCNWKEHHAMSFYLSLIHI